LGNYRQVFPGARTVLPVIHVESARQALRNALIARDAGADGAFLINHTDVHSVLLDIHQEVAEANPGWWVGVNCLDLMPHQVFEVISGHVAGVWSDNADIQEDQDEQPYADRVSALATKLAPDCLYFGGVAFKYQRQVEDLAAAAAKAARFMDVVTTNGPGTGRAADLDKILAMKYALGDTPLAIASGITPENVADYLPFADSFLVATGISRSFTELDPARVTALVERVRGWAARG
jgi:hypothetical protein